MVINRRSRLSFVDNLGHGKLKNMPVNQKLKNYPVFSMKIIGMQILRLLVPKEVW